MLLLLQTFDWVLLINFNSFYVGFVADILIANNLLIKQSYLCAYKSILSFFLSQFCFTNASYVIDKVHTSLEQSEYGIQCENLHVFV